MVAISSGVPNVHVVKVVSDVLSKALTSVGKPSPISFKGPVVNLSLLGVIGVIGITHANEIMKMAATVVENSSLLGAIAKDNDGKPSDEIVVDPDAVEYKVSLDPNKSSEKSSISKGIGPGAS